MLEVADTGIGIPEVERERLFERFFRGSGAATEASSGTGLGLAIAKSIVDAHHGTIAVESEESHGTTVRAAFPTSAAVTPLEDAA